MVLEELPVPMEDCRHSGIHLQLEGRRFQEGRFDLETDRWMEAHRAMEDRLLIERSRHLERFRYSEDQLVLVVGRYLMVVDRLLRYWHGEPFQLD